MSEGKLKNYLNVLKNEEQQFLNFLKAKYPIFHKSNFFYRDLQFGIRKFFEIKGIDLSLRSVILGRHGFPRLED